MSLLKVAQKALRKLGVAQEISALTDGTPAAKRCSAAVVDVVKDVLREHPWSFATIWATLAKLPAAPPFGYDFAYQLPSGLECVRVWDIRQDPDLEAALIDFDVVRNNVVYTDASPCYARYIVYNEADLTVAPPDFIEAAAFLLASEIATPLAKAELMSPMMNGYNMFLDKARLNDASGRRERVSDPARECTFLKARRFPASMPTNEDL